MIAAPRPPLANWLRASFFATPASAAVSLLLAGGLLWVLPGIVDWALLKAVFRPDVAACRALEHGGACWGVVAEKWRAIIFGRYPFEQQWRPFAATLMVLAALAASGLGWLRGLRLALAWLLVLPVFLVLMGGGMAGLAPVGTEYWGGLPLTLLLTLAGMAMAMPLAVLVAYGRLSRSAWLRTASGAYVELVRGVPLISVLFMASFMLPMFMPRGLSVDVLLRVTVGIVLFAAAYLAETIRGGLQAVPLAQRQAAAALGLSRWQAERWVVLPQAMRAVVPSLINSAISLFKDTSLVTVVSLYELTGSLSLALSGDPQWRAFYLEGYLFIGLIYWLGCYSLSRWSAGLVTQTSRHNG